MAAILIYFHHLNNELCYYGFG